MITFSDILDEIETLVGGNVCFQGGPMKKWHMEGIIYKANDLQRKVVFGDRNQIVICPGSYSFVNPRKLSLMNYFRVFSTLVSRRS